MNASDVAQHAAHALPALENNSTPAAGKSNRVESVLAVRHWNDSLFSFTTTRSPSFRFETGQFVMVGLQRQGRPLMRAYSLASPSHEEHLEFFSIKVPGGPLTTELQHLQPGDGVLVGNKPTGTLILSDLRPGRVLYLLCTGTGLAPFLGLAGDPETYAAFEKVALVHGVRSAADLAYREYLQEELPRHDYLGEAVRSKLVYYPTVTREPFPHQGRITDLIADNRLCDDIGLPALSPGSDRVMICGGPAMLAETRALLDARGFAVSPGRGHPGDYVVERAFADA